MVISYERIFPDAEGLHFIIQMRAWMSRIASLINSSTNFKAPALSP